MTNLNSWDDDAYLDEDYEEDYDDYPRGDDPCADDPGPAFPPGRLLCTAQDVHEHLLAVVGPERDGPRTLWVLFLDSEERALPLVIPIDSLPTMVDRTTVANLAHTLRTLVAENGPGGSVAFGLVRRAGGDRGTFEAGWSEALREAMDAVGVPVRAIVAIGRDRSRVLPFDQAA